MDPTVDRYSAAGTRPRAASTAAIGSFIRRLNLIDVFRGKHPEDPGYTWYQTHHQVAERLDMFFVTSFGL